MNIGNLAPNARSFKRARPFDVDELEGTPRPQMRRSGAQIWDDDSPRQSEA